MYEEDLLTWLQQQLQLGTDSKIFVIDGLNTDSGLYAIPGNCNNNNNNNDSNNNNS